MRLMNVAIISLAALALTSCGSKNQEAQADQDNVANNELAVQAPTFNADSAYSFVKAQCDFGPRVPGTQAHQDCGNMLEKKLNQLCDTVITQHAQVTTFDNTRLNISNYIGIFNPDASKRILLLAHWDSRPWADNDPDPDKQTQPVIGANDGASGVGVLLEVARVLAANKPAIGVDILFTDAEDWGTNNDEDSWALGTQYWVQHPHVQGYSPMYGILLDMVGAAGARFEKEGYSSYYAPQVVSNVWNKAQTAGYGNLFSTMEGGAVTDDHVTINQAGIPCIDIIDMRRSSPTGFFQQWHTTHDTMNSIDRNTLKAVGQTLINLLQSYN